MAITKLPLQFEEAGAAKSTNQSVRYIVAM
jgi:hypothetical protein